MAFYWGEYTNDLSFTKIDPIAVYLWLFGDTRQETSTDFDSEYLPSVFLNNVLINHSGYLNKEARQSNQRIIILNLDIQALLIVPIPFLPYSNNYNLFFSEIKSNNKILNNIYQGENIGEDFVSLYASK